MKKKQKTEIRAKTAEELVSELKKRQEEVVKLGVEVKMARIKNTSLLRRKLDELALIKTILREMEFAKKGLLLEEKGVKTK